jgi:hypothetical protein
VAIEDLVRAHSMVRKGTGVATGGRPFAASARELAEDQRALPLSPLLPEARAVGQDLLEPGERVPLVLEPVTTGSFRAVVAVWATEEDYEIVETAERLEALLGMWDGTIVSEARWMESHTVARELADRRVREISARAAAEELAALRRQVEAARSRLMRELGRFLACSAGSGEEFNAAFHRAMQRGGQVGALLVRAHGLLGYPNWSDDLVRGALEVAERLSANQKKNVLLGTPLEAAVRDPRWAAAGTLETLHRASHADARRIEEAE